MSSIIIIIVIIKEGPHSQIKEEQFFDAIDNTLDNLELEEERVRKSFLIEFIKLINFK
jgi:hypothetical protein